MKNTIIIVFLIGLIASTQAEQETDDPTLYEQFENLARKKCLSNGKSNDTYDKATNVWNEMVQCIVSVSKEIHDEETNKEAPSETSSEKSRIIDGMKKICAKSPVFTQCTTKFSTGIEPCFEEEEKKNMKYIPIVTESLLKFFCDNESDQVIRFASTNISEYSQELEKLIEECGMRFLNPTANASEMIMPEALPKFTLENQQCNEITNFQTCLVKGIKEWPHPIGANIIESMFKTVMRKTPCNSAANFIVNYFLLTILAFISFRYL